MPPRLLHASIIDCMPRLNPLFRPIFSCSSNSYIGICNGIEDGKVSLEIKNKDNTTKTETILIEDIKKATLC